MKIVLRLLAAVLLMVATPVRAQMLADVVDLTVGLDDVSAVVAGKTTRYATVSRPVFLPFTGIAVEAEAAGDIRVHVRLFGTEGPGPWIDMTVVRSAVGDAFVAGFHGDELLDAERFEVRIETDLGVPVSVRGAGVFNGLADDEIELPFAPPVAAAAAGNIIPPTLITRDEWGARPFQLGSPVPLARPTYDYMTFHHAAGYSATTREEGLAQLRAIQDLHQNVRGWSDIGYQFVIDRSGRLYQGRPFMTDATSLNQVPVLARGAHVGGANTGNIGVCMLGCYHPSEGSHCEQEITPEALDTYTTLFAFLSERYGVSPSRIRGHRDFSSTACPGDNNYALLPDLRGAVSELLVTGNQPFGVASIATTVDDDGVVHVQWDIVEDQGIVRLRVERETDAGSTTIYESDGANSLSIADAGVTRSGDVTYSLYGISESGREQRFAQALVTLDDPNGFKLTAAFPNPAGNQVQFRYFLRSEGRVTLDVFDVLGRQVANIVDAVQPEDSWHSVPFNTAGLAGGVYFTHIRVDGFGGRMFTESRTFIVQR